MNPAHQKAILAELSKTIVCSILEATPNIPQTVLEELSLAGQLNILFLLRGSYGSVGDYVTTQRALRHWWVTMRIGVGQEAAKNESPARTPALN